ncbi:unnamed protein product [Phaeothamnion confervicola]
MLPRRPPSDACLSARPPFWLRHAAPPLGCRFAQTCCDVQSERERGNIDAPRRKREASASQRKIQERQPASPVARFLAHHSSTARALTRPQGRTWWEVKKRALVFFALRLQWKQLRTPARPERAAHDRMARSEVLGGNRGGASLAA